jgi:hypothetical protein
MPNNHRPCSALGPSASDEAAQRALPANPPMGLVLGSGNFRVARIRRCIRNPSPGAIIGVRLGILIDGPAVQQLDQPHPADRAFAPAQLSDGLSGEFADRPTTEQHNPHTRMHELRAATGGLLRRGEWTVPIGYGIQQDGTHVYWVASADLNVDSQLGDCGRRPVRRRDERLRQSELL